jgi:hypothetical protein
LVGGADEQDPRSAAAAQRSLQNRKRPAGVDAVGLFGVHSRGSDRALCREVDDRLGQQLFQLRFDGSAIADVEVAIGSRDLETFV